jgi:drug/metabolite transporter (DMT)-like permease
MKRQESLSFDRPAKWAIVLAFALVYLSWGTTYLAIKKGVESCPPAIFSGFRVGLAGMIVLGYLGLRGQAIRLALREFLWTALVGCLMFVGGNGLLTLGEKVSVASGMASVLGATTPFWIALLELFWPWGERLNGRGWLGLMLGLLGVLVLLAPTADDAASLLADAGPWFILGSSISWALGSVIMRYRRIKGSYLVVAAYQMIVGGLALVLIGCGCGEFAELSLASATPASIYSFFHLLVFGSLVGFVAFIWLLGHVSATLVGTHAYVNPAVAVLAGWLINSEAVTAWLLGGMAVILIGVALVRAGGAESRKRHEETDQSVAEPENALHNVLMTGAPKCAERAT